MFDLLNGQTAQPDQIKIEDGMLGHRVMAHLEDDILIRAAGFIDFSSGHCSELINRSWVTRDTGIGSGDGLGSNILSLRGIFPEFLNDFRI